MVSFSTKGQSDKSQVVTKVCRTKWKGDDINIIDFRCPVTSSYLLVLLFDNVKTCKNLVV